MAGTARGGNGDYVRDPDVAERDAKGMRLRASGYTWQRIADELGYADRAHAKVQIERSYRANMKQDVQAYRETVDAQLDELYAAAMAVKEARHLKVTNGSVVFDPESGGLMEDDAPVLAAIDRMIKIVERRAKLYGLDAPTKVQAEVQNVRVTVEGAEDV